MKTETLTAQSRKKLFLANKKTVFWNFRPPDTVVAMTRPAGHFLTFLALRGISTAISQKENKHTFAVLRFQEKTFRAMEEKRTGPDLRGKKRFRLRKNAFWLRETQEKNGNNAVFFHNLAHCSAHDV